MGGVEQKWISALNERANNAVYRQLRVDQPAVDFYSNDYLGLARSVEFQQDLLTLAQAKPAYLTGATGSRLISGNSSELVEVEAFIAEQHQVEAALLFDSGYKANLSLFSAIATRGVTLIVDALVHRSVHDGSVLGRGHKWKFRHNDLMHLESLLRKARGEVIVVVESLYSMDGDFAPLLEIIRLSDRYGARVVVDEAHAIGVFGKGLVAQYGLQNQVFAVVSTYGKAMGLSGAAILGSQLLKEYLINFSSGFIYSTGMSIMQAQSIKLAYQFLQLRSELPLVLQQHIAYLRSFALPTFSEAKSPIQAIKFRSMAQLKEVRELLLSQKYNVYAVFSPTVKLGEERLRLSVHSFNTKEEIGQLCQLIRSFV